MWWLWWWLLFVLLFLLLPLGYGLGYRRWGFPNPYRRPGTSRSERRIAERTEDEEAAEWGILAVILWVMFSIAMIWFVIAIFIAL